MPQWYIALNRGVSKVLQQLSALYRAYHRLKTPSEEITFTARPKINSHSQIFRYGRSIFCLPHRPIFSDIFDLCFHWVSVVRDPVNILQYTYFTSWWNVSKSRSTDTQWRHKSIISEKLGWCGRQNMLRPYLKIWDWDWISGRAVKAFSSLGVRSPWSVWLLTNNSQGL